MTARNTDDRAKFALPTLKAKETRAENWFAVSPVSIRGDISAMNTSRSAFRIASPSSGVIVMPGVTGGGAARPVWP
nr:hypothetical protein [Kaustia mangrovi]